MTTQVLASRIARLDGIVPEQIASVPNEDTDAVLVDQWARQHALREVTVIGRDAANPLAVLQTSVSRRHAELRHDAATDTWTIVDLGSRNGTFVEGARVGDRPQPLGDRQLVRIGDVGFVFVLDRDTLPAARPTESFRATAQSGATALLRISAATTEGAGVAAFGEESVAIGPTQFALLRLLATRYRDSAGESEEVRGFVRSIELITDLPWNTARPEDNHVKQQVRRLRRALERLGLPEAIESRHGFGYRLAIPAVLD